MGKGRPPKHAKETPALDKKMASRKRRKRKHLLLWENARGIIPKNHVVIFLDGDHKNCVLENLRMVSKSVHTRMLKNRLYSSNPETTEQGIAECQAIKPSPKKGRAYNIFSPEIISCMKNSCKDAGSFPKLAGLVNSGFGTSYTGKQVKDWFYRQGIKPSPGRGRGGKACGMVSAMGRMAESAAPLKREKFTPYKTVPQMHALWSISDMRTGLV